MAPSELRPLLPADLAAVEAIERATFPDPWSRRAFLDSLANEHVCALALEDAAGALIGYGIGQVAADEGEILNLAVAEAERGRGAGRRLMAGLLEALRGRGAVRAFLEVRRSNEAAIALYRAVGFTSLGVRRGYYERPHEDALTMTLELGSQDARKW